MTIGVSRLALSVVAWAATVACDGPAPGSSRESAQDSPALSAENVQPAAAAANSSCAAGTWRAPPPDPNDSINGELPLQYETAHFAFRYKTQTATRADVEAAGVSLENIFNHFMYDVGFPEPYCNSADKKKALVYIGQGYGLSGGLDGTGSMAMWIGPGALKDNFGLAHEYTHGLQGSTGGFQNTNFGSWLWESHANWMALQLPEFRRKIVHCSEMQVNYPHLYLGTTRMRYCNWQFMEHLKNRYGYGIINNIWKNAPKAGSPQQSTGDPFLTLMSNMGWSIDRLNDELGVWAMHNANWDYTNPDGTDQGAFYRAQYGPYQNEANARIRRMTTLDAMDLGQRRFSVPFMQAPQRWGYNLVRVRPDAGASSVTVAFRGVTQAAPATSSFPGMQNEPATVPQPNSGWRWGMVAVDSAGKSRYTELQRATSGSATIPVNASDQAVYLIVMGAPTQMTQIRWDQPFYSIYRYPWMVQFTNAMPDGFQPDAPAPVPGGTRHANGGGWVAPSASVAASAYVGPNARVLGGTVSGNARIEDQAVVVSGTVIDNAVVGGLSVIRGNTVLRNAARATLSFLGLGEYEQNITLSGNAQNIGDVEQRGASFSTGVYYGFVDQAASSDPSRGSIRTTAVPEVTARPNYIWY